jgi:thiamine biosynthesis lipoprotein
MAELLGFALDVAEETGGAFDVTVGPVVLLWRRARRQRVLPEGWRIERAMEAVGWGGVELDRVRRVVELKRKGMRLDFGGVAKGYAAREALKVLQGRGVRSCMVAGSGDMAMGAAPQGGEGWRIRIAALEGASGEGEVLTLSNQGIATSGDVNQFVEVDGVRYSHVIDPRTGWAHGEAAWRLTVVGADGGGIWGVGGAVWRCGVCYSVGTFFDYVGHSIDSG